MVLDEAAAEAAAAAVVATAVIDWFKRSCWQIWLRRGKYDTVKCRQSAKRRKEKLMAQLMQFSDNECHRSVIDDRSGRWVRPSLPFSPSQQQLIYILSYGDRGKSYRFSLFFSTVLFCLFSWLVGWLVGWFVRFLFVVVDVVDVIVDVVALRFCCFVWVLLASSPFWFFRCYLCQRRFFDSKWIRWTDGANTFIWFLFFFFFFFFCGWLQLMASTVESCLVSLCFISNCMISYRNYSRILQVRSVIEKSKADSVMLCFPISVYCVSHDIILYKRLILNVARTACWLTCKQHTKHIKLIYHTAVVACILVVHTEWWILDGRNWIINGRWLAMGAGEDWGWRIEDGGLRMEDGGWRMEDGGGDAEGGEWLGKGWNIAVRYLLLISVSLDREQERRKRRHSFLFLILFFFVLLYVTSSLYPFFFYSYSYFFFVFATFFFFFVVSFHLFGGRARVLFLVVAAWIRQCRGIPRWKSEVSIRCAAFVGWKRPLSPLESVRVHHIDAGLRSVSAPSSDEAALKTKETTPCAHLFQILQFHKFKYSNRTSNALMGWL